MDQKKFIAAIVAAVLIVCLISPGKCRAPSLTTDATTSKVQHHNDSNVDIKLGVPRLRQTLACYRAPTAVESVLSYLGKASLAHTSFVMADHLYRRLRPNFIGETSTARLQFVVNEILREHNRSFLYTTTRTGSFSNKTRDHLQFSEVVIESLINEIPVFLSYQGVIPRRGITKYYKPHVHVVVIDGVRGNRQHPAELQYRYMDPESGEYHYLNARHLELLQQVEVMSHVAVSTKEHEDYSAKDFGGNERLLFPLYLNMCHGLDFQNSSSSYRSSNFCQKSTIYGNEIIVVKLIETNYRHTRLNMFIGTTKGIYSSTDKELSDLRKYWDMDFPVFDIVSKDMSYFEYSMSEKRDVYKSSIYKTERIWNSSTDEVTAFVLRIVLERDIDMFWLDSSTYIGTTNGVYLDSIRTTSLEKVQGLNFSIADIVLDQRGGVFIVSSDSQLYRMNPKGTGHNKYTFNGANKVLSLLVFEESHSTIPSCSKGSFIVSTDTYVYIHNPDKGNIINTKLNVNEVITRLAWRDDAHIEGQSISGGIVIIELKSTK